MNADHARPQKRLGVVDRTVHVGLGGEIDDRVNVPDQPVDRSAIRDIALHEFGNVGSPAIDVERLARLPAYVSLSRTVIWVPSPRARIVAHEARADEPGSAGHEQALRRRRGHPSVGRWVGGRRVPVAASAEASSAARSSDGTVPASVQWPS